MEDSLPTLIPQEQCREEVEAEVEAREAAVAVAAVAVVAVAARPGHT